MPKPSIRSVPKEPRAESLKKSHRILTYTQETLDSLLDAFDKQSEKRGRGASTVEQQDLLRSMLIMAGSGLDAMLKQIALDAFRDIMEGSDKAQEEFRQFVVRQFERADGGLGAKTIAKYLVADSPRQRLIADWIEEIRGKSMQSVDQIQAASAYFGIPNRLTVVQTHGKMLRDAFLVRNQIAHEMDVDFDQPKRARRPRNRKQMVDYVNLLLDLCAEFLREADELITRGSS